MLRQFLLTVAMIVLPYLLYALADALRQRRREQGEQGVVVTGGFWQRAPVFALGLVGCLLAVTTLIAVAVIETRPDQPRYDPPVIERSE